MTEIQDISVREKEIKFVLIVTFFLNIASAAIKFFIGKEFLFLSLSSSGVESLFDGSANVLALISIHIASQPADEDHPYGHQKFETLGSLLLAGLLIFSAIGMSKQAYEFYNSGITEKVFSYYPFIAILVSMAISLFVSKYEKRKGEELNSPLLLADADHTFGDFIISFAVLISLVTGYMGHYLIDVITSGFVGIYLTVLAFKIFKQNFPDLVDTSPIIPNSLIKQVENIPKIVDIHNFRSRGNSNWMHVDFHLHLDADLSLREAHKVGQEAEKMMRELLNNYTHQLDVTVHIEPYDEEHKAKQS
jgi:cation diffusion facilitator family transporter